MVSLVVRISLYGLYYGMVRVRLGKVEGVGGGTLRQFLVCGWECELFSLLYNNDVCVWLWSCVRRRR